MRHYGKEEQKGMSDYVVVDERLRKVVLNAKVERGSFKYSDHFAVLVEMKIRGKWRYGN